MLSSVFVSQCLGAYLVWHVWGMLWLYKGEFIGNKSQDDKNSQHIKVKLFPACLESTTMDWWLG